MHAFKIRRGSCAEAAEDRSGGEGAKETGQADATDYRKICKYQSNNWARQLSEEG